MAEYPIYHAESNSYNEVPQLPSNPDRTFDSRCIVLVVRGSMIDSAQVIISDDDYDLGGAMNIAHIRNGLDGGLSYVVTRDSGGTIEYDHEGKLQRQLGLPENTPLSLVLDTTRGGFIIVMDGNGIN